MGQMRFLVPQRKYLPTGAMERAYLAGIEGVPWRSRNQWIARGHSEPTEFVIERNVRESGNLNVLWQVPGQGTLTLSSASLMERSEPYLLPVELARGTLNRLRNQMADWEAQGLRISPKLDALRQAATSSFVKAATSQQDWLVASESAQESLQSGLSAADQLCAEWIAFGQRARQNNAGVSFAPLLGGQVELGQISPEAARTFVDTFNLGVVPLTWKEIEATSGTRKWDTTDARIDWCWKQGLQVCAGPLLRLDQLHLPDWIYLWEDDFEQLQSCLLSFVQASIHRYRGRVHVWHLSSRINLRGVLALPEELKLRLIVNVLESARSLDPRTPIVISFDQPWGEYLSGDDTDLSPLHFADSLSRADLGIAALGLEINHGYWPGGTLPRDALDISRQIDRWSQLGLPLILMLDSPSSDAPDPAAKHSARALTDIYAGGTTAEGQRRFAEFVYPLLLAKPTVQGIIWNQGLDVVPHEFPHGGVVDGTGRSKPLLDTLKGIRAQYGKR